MRIQDTDRILKEARYARSAAREEHEGGVMSRAWRVVSSLPMRLTALFRRD